MGGGPFPECGVGLASSFMMGETHKHGTIPRKIQGWNQLSPCLRPLVLGMPSLTPRLCYAVGMFPK